MFFTPLHTYTIILVICTGHEVIGLDKIPADGPALLIYYHGALPVDVYYLVAKLLLLKDRQVRAVGDRFLFRIPGNILLILHVYSLPIYMPYHPVACC